MVAFSWVGTKEWRASVSDESLRSARRRVTLKEQLCEPQEGTLNHELLSSHDFRDALQENVSLL